MNGKRLMALLSLALTCLLPGLAFAYTTPGTGVNYTMADIDALTTDVTRNGDDWVISADLNISATDTLTLAAGDTLLFDDFTGLRLYGDLTADGTTADPVVVSSSSATPSPGIYYGIQVYEAVNLTLDHLSLNWAGLQAFPSSGQAIIQATASEFNESIIIPQDSFLTLDGCSLYNSTSPPIDLGSNTVPTLSNNRFRGSFDYYINDLSAADIGGMTGNQLLGTTFITDFNVSGNNDQILTPTIWTQPGNYVFRSFVTVDMAGSLDINLPGSRLMFWSEMWGNSYGIRAYGPLTLTGTAGTPLVLSSAEALGGESYWEGINVDGGDLTADYVDIIGGSINAGGYSNPMAVNLANSSLDSSLNLDYIDSFTLSGCSVGQAPIYLSSNVTVTAITDNLLHSTDNYYIDGLSPADVGALSGNSLRGAPTVTDFNVSGNNDQILTPTIWTQPGNYVFRSFVTVDMAGSLEINLPGSRLMFWSEMWGNSYGIHAFGPLTLTGTAGTPLVLSSAEELGGESYWEGITGDNANLSLNYVDLGGGQLSVSGSYTQTTVSLTNSSVNGAIYLSYLTGFTLDGCSVGGYQLNLDQEVSISAISNNRFHSFEDYYINGLSASDLWTLSGNSLLGAPMIADFFVNGNNNNITNDQVWSQSGRYLFPSSVYIDSAASVTINGPGSDYAFLAEEWTTYRFDVYGRLSATGAPGAPITFRAESPTGYNWEGIYLEDGASLALDQVHFSDAVIFSYGYSEPPDISITNSSMAGEMSIEAANSFVLNGSSVGATIYFGDVTVNSIANNRFHNDYDYYIRNLSAAHIGALSGNSLLSYRTSDFEVTGARNVISSNQSWTQAANYYFGRSVIVDLGVSLDIDYLTLLFGSTNMEIGFPGEYVPIYYGFENYGALDINQSYLAPSWEEPGLGQWLGIAVLGGSLSLTSTWVEDGLMIDNQTGASSVTFTNSQLHGTPVVLNQLSFTMDYTEIDTPMSISDCDISSMTWNRFDVWGADYYVTGLQLTNLPAIRDSELSGDAANYDFGFTSGTGCLTENFDWQEPGRFYFAVDLCVDSAGTIMNQVQEPLVLLFGSTNYEFAPGEFEYRGAGIVINGGYVDFSGSSEVTIRDAYPFGSVGRWNGVTNNGGYFWASDVVMENGPIWSSSGQVTLQTSTLSQVPITLTNTDSLSLYGNSITVDGPGRSAIELSADSEVNGINGNTFRGTDVDYFVRGLKDSDLSQYNVDYNFMLGNPAGADFEIAYRDFPYMLEWTQGGSFDVRVELNTNGGMSINAPGAEIRFRNDSDGYPTGLNVTDSLSVLGAPGNPVTFMAGDTAWNGIQVYNQAVDMEHVRMTGRGIVCQPEGTLHLSNLEISNAEIGISCSALSGSYINAVQIHDVSLLGLGIDGPARVQNCIITTSGVDAVRVHDWATDVPDFGDGTLVSVGGNEFVNTGAGYAFNNQSSLNIMARHNHWGSMIEDEIRATIWDGNDNPALGEVNFFEWVEAEFTNVSLAPQPAEPGQTLTISFTVRDTPQATPVVTVAGQPASVQTESGHDYSFSYLVTGSAPERHGANPLAIAFTDGGGNYRQYHGVAQISIDRDHDGLGDADELLYGTDPDNPDTDADNMTDGYEVQHGTCLNPLYDDQYDNPDSDGYDNATEFLHGSNPCVYADCSDGYDTDGDSFTDIDDPGCANWDDTSEYGAGCDDGIDNDADGNTDWPMDSSCDDLADASEMNISLLSTTAVFGEPLDKTGNHLLFAEPIITSMDVTDPAGPVFGDTVFTYGIAYKVVAHGDRAWVISDRGIDIFDISDPDNLVLAGGTEVSEWPREIAVARNRVITSGIYTTIMTDSVPPVQLGLINNYPDGTDDVIAIAGPYLLASHIGAADSIRSYNIGDPADPQLAGEYQLDGGRVADIQVRGLTAYVATGVNLGIFSLDNTGGLTRLSGSTCEAMDIAVEGDYVYVAAGAQGLQVINISDPYNPVVAAVYDTEDAREVLVEDGVVYLMDVVEGLIILRAEIVDAEPDLLPDSYEYQHACLLVGNLDADADPDTDGLTSHEEFKLGTDPCEADTDQDMLSDGDEVAADADPFWPDTDLDGLDDGTEMGWGTDPADPDTDNGGESDGSEYDRGSNQFNRFDDFIYRTIAYENTAVSWPIFNSVNIFRSQMIYGQGEMAGGYKIASIGFQFISPPGLVENLQIRLKNSATTSFSSNLFDNAGWSSGFTGDATVNVPGWHMFNLETPFYYSGINSLMVDVSAYRVSGGGYASFSSSWTGAYQNLHAFAFSGGNPAAWTGASNPTAYRDNLRPNIRFGYAPADSDGDGMTDDYENFYACLNPFVQDDLDDDDSDTIINMEEWNMVTNPCDPDTDADGMDDGWEFNHSCLDIRHGDSLLDADSDGLTNLAEYTLGADPCDSDTDDDTFEDGVDCDPVDPDNWTSCATCADADADTWFAGCDAYTAHTGPDCDDGNINAWTNCATCVDADTDTWFVGCDQYQTINGPDCDDGAAAVHPGQPSPEGPGVLCDTLDNQCPGETGYGEIDEGCVLPDSDSDGIPDATEILLGTNPNDSDSDDDGLDDGYEYNTLGTNPLDWDSDADGLPDDFEAANMTGHPENLSPLGGGDGAADFDGDGNSNVNEYYNGSDLWAANITGEAGCGFWGDSDGDRFISPSDNATLRAFLRGLAISYSLVVPDNGETQEMDMDGFRSPGDVTLLGMMIKGLEIVTLNSRPNQIVALSPAAVTAQVGDTVRLTIGLGNTGASYTPGFGVVFSIAPASTGGGVIVGGDGGSGAGRYDLGGTIASQALSSVVVRVTSPGAIVVDVSAPECGADGKGRWAPPLTLAPPFEITVE